MEGAAALEESDIATAEARAGWVGFFVRVLASGLDEVEEDKLLIPCKSLMKRFYSVIHTEPQLCIYRREAMRPRAVTNTQPEPTRVDLINLDQHVLQT